GSRVNPQLPCIHLHNPPFAGTHRPRLATYTQKNRRMPTRLEEQLRTTLSSIGDAVISTDLDGRIVFANKVAYHLLRAEEGSLIGRDLNHVFRICNEITREKVENPIERVLREGIVVGLANHTVL